MSMPTYESLLADDDILIVNKKLAKAVGLNCSIVLRQLRYWMQISEKSRDPRKFKNDRWWTYNTYQNWVDDNFPFWSVPTLRRALDETEALCLVMSTAEYNQRKNDNTKWYTIDFFNYNRFMELWYSMGQPAAHTRKDSEYGIFMMAWAKLLLSDQVDQMVRSSRSDGLIKLIGALPDISSEDTTDITNSPPNGGAGDGSNEKPIKPEKIADYIKRAWLYEQDGVTDEQYQTLNKTDKRTALHTAMLFYGKLRTPEEIATFTPEFIYSRLGQGLETNWLKAAVNQTGLDNLTPRIIREAMTAYRADQYGTLATNAGLIADAIDSYARLGHLPGKESKPAPAHSNGKERRLPAYGEMK